MGKTIARSLPFVKNSLTLKESADFLDWYNFLDLPDKRNVGEVLRASYDCTMQYAPPYRHNNYFVMNAIASTARAEPDYDDVDLLMFTNALRSHISYLSRLEEMLERDFIYGWDMNPGEAYERPGRSVLELIPIGGKGKKIHFTVQPEIRSEGEWNKLDQESRVVIYRLGDTSGRSPREERLYDWYGNISTIGRGVIISIV